MARVVKESQAHWLILGSFPLKRLAKSDLLDFGYKMEAQFAPAAGEEFDGRTWTPYAAPVIDFLDPSLALKDREWCYAYAASYVYSPKAAKTLMLIGSDDGVLAYLNGKEVHRNDCMRIYTADQDQARVALREGWNTLVFKVTQGEMAWAPAHDSPRLTGNL